MTAAGPSRDDDAAVVVTQQIAAEASVWIARLHGPGRSPKMERDCLAWQARSAAHRLAFEKCTEVWEAVPGVRLADAYASAAQRSDSEASVSRANSSRLLSALAGLLVLGSGVGYMAMNRGEAHATKVGEQQVVLLDDGTRVTLNTDTMVHVEMGSTERSVKVDRGEALFEVAKDAARPFVVRAAGSEVVAVGTQFAVRLSDGGEQSSASLAVTLIEGQVTLRAQDGLFSDGVAPANPLTLKPGERVSLTSGDGQAKEAAHERRDRPNIEKLVAWKRNEAVFEDVSLPDAVAEMNRYSRTRIVLQGQAALAQLRVSGLFRTSDSAGFAHAVASLHGLKVHEHPGRLELALTQ